MEDSFFGTGRATTSQVRADDVEFESLLRRAAEALKSRRSPANQEESLPTPGRDSDT